MWVPGFKNLWCLWIRSCLLHFEFCFCPIDKLIAHSCQSIKIYIKKIYNYTENKIVTVALFLSYIVYSTYNGITYPKDPNRIFCQLQLYLLHNTTYDCVCVIIRPLLCCGQIYRKSSDTIMGMGLSLGDPEAGEGNILLPGECMVWGLPSEWGVSVHSGPLLHVWTCLVAGMMLISIPDAHQPHHTHKFITARYLCIHNQRADDNVHFHTVWITFCISC